MVQRTCNCGEALLPKRRTCDKCKRANRGALKRRSYKRRIESVRQWNAAYQETRNIKTATYRHNLRTYFCYVIQNTKSKQSAVRNLNRTIKEFKISIDFVVELWHKQGGKCAITGMDMIHRPNELCGASVDRIDNSRGYLPDNVHLVCRWVNLARGKFTLDEFRKVLGDFSQLLLQSSQAIPSFSMPTVK